MNDIRITLQGNAGETPQLWENGSRPFARVNVASTPRMRIDGEWVDGETQWMQVKAWGRLAENIAASIRKGDAVIVTGTFRHEEYTNDEGVQYRTAVVHANGVGFDLRRTRAQAVSIREEGPAPAAEEGESGWTDLAQVPQQGAEPSPGTRLGESDAPF